MLALIAIDCAEPAILEAMMASGDLPTLASLAARGSVVPLSGDGDTMEGSVIQTLLTGVNPGKHGIYKYQQIVPGTYDYELSSAENSPVPQIWKVLSDQGQFCCVFDFPRAYAQKGLNGKLVASWGSYSPASQAGSVPESLLGHIQQRFGTHPMRIQHPLPLRPSNYEDACNTLQEAIRTRAEACLSILGDERWDFFATAFSESHVAAHQFWQLRDPDHPMYDARSAHLCGDAIEKIYGSIDKYLGRILEALPSNGNVVVLTQNGVQNNYTGSHLLPNWLAKREGREFRPQLLVGVDELVGSSMRNFIRRNIPESMANRLIKKKFPANGDVFMLPGSEYVALLRVNLKGREPAGSVPADEYKQVLEKLSAQLLGLKNAATGLPAVGQVLLTHDIHEGPCLDHLPDVLVCWSNDRPIEALECPEYGTISEGILFTDITHSMHTSRGMAIIAGGGIPRGKVDIRHDIRDLTATLYSLAEADMPETLEGIPIFG